MTRTNDNNVGGSFFKFLEIKKSVHWNILRFKCCRILKSAVTQHTPHFHKKGFTVMVHKYIFASKAVFYFKISL